MILSDWISGCLDTKHLTKTKQSKLPKPIKNLKQKMKRRPNGYRHSLTDTGLYQELQQQHHLQGSVTSHGETKVAHGFDLWPLSSSSRPLCWKKGECQAGSLIIPLAEYSISFLGASGQQTLTTNCQRSVFDFTRALRVSSSAEDPSQSGGCAPPLGCLFLLLNPKLHNLLP